MQRIASEGKFTDDAYLRLDVDQRKMGYSSALGRKWKLQLEYGRIPHALAGISMQFVYGRDSIGLPRYAENVLHR